MKTTNPKTQKAPNSDEALLTRGMLTHMFENMKDFVHSTIKAFETRSRKDFGRLEIAVTSHSKMIKDLDTKITDVRTELKSEIQSVRTELIEKMDSMESNLTGVRTELKSEMQGVRTELKSEMQGVRTELKSEMQGVRTDLIEKMDSVESNLTEKIEGQKPILQNHEVRITALEGL